MGKKLQNRDKWKDILNEIVTSVANHSKISKETQENLFNVMAMTDYNGENRDEFFTFIEDAILQVSMKEWGNSEKERQKWNEVNELLKKFIKEKENEWSELPKDFLERNETKKIETIAIPTSPTLVWTPASYVPNYGNDGEIQNNTWKKSLRYIVEKALSDTEVQLLRAFEDDFTNGQIVEKENIQLYTKLMALLGIKPDPGTGYFPVLTENQLQQLLTDADDLPGRIRECFKADVFPFVKKMNGTIFLLENSSDSAKGGELTTEEKTEEKTENKPVIQDAETPQIEEEKKEESDKTEEDIEEGVEENTNKKENRGLVVPPEAQLVDPSNNRQELQTKKEEVEEKTENEVENNVENELENEEEEIIAPQALQQWASNTSTELVPQTTTDLVPETAPGQLVAPATARELVPVEEVNEDITPEVTPKIAGLLDAPVDTVQKQVKITQDDILSAFEANFVNTKEFHQQAAKKFATEGYGPDGKPITDPMGRKSYNDKSFWNQVGLIGQYFMDASKKRKFMNEYMKKAQNIYNLDKSTQSELAKRAAYAARFSTSGIAWASNYQKLDTFQIDEINTIAEEFRQNRNQDTAVRKINKLMKTATGDRIRQKYLDAGMSKLSWIWRGMSKEDVQYLASNLVEQIKAQADTATKTINFIKNVKSSSNLSQLQTHVDNFYVANGSYPSFIFKFCANPKNIQESEFSLIKSNAVLQGMNDDNMKMRLKINAYYQKEGAQIGSAELDKSHQNVWYRLGKKLDDMPWGARIATRGWITIGATTLAAMSSAPLAVAGAGAWVAMFLQALKTNYESKEEWLENVRMHLEDRDKLNRIKEDLEKKLKATTWFGRNMWFGKADRWSKQLRLINGVVNLSTDADGDPYVFPIEKRLADLSAPTTDANQWTQRALIIDTLARMDVAGETNRSAFSAQNGHKVAKNEALLSVLQEKALTLFPPTWPLPSDQQSWVNYWDKHVRGQDEYKDSTNAYTKAHDAIVKSTTKAAGANVLKDLYKKGLVMTALGVTTFYATDALADWAIDGIDASHLKAPETFVEPGLENQWNLGDHTSSQLVQKDFTTTWDSVLNTRVNDITNGSQIDFTFGAWVDGVPASLTKYSDALVEAKQQALTNYVKTNCSPETYDNFLKAFDDNGINDLKQFVVGKGVTDGNTNLFAMRAMEGTEKMLMELQEAGKLKDVSINFTFDQSVSAAGGPAYVQGDRMFTWSVDVHQRVEETTSDGEAINNGWIPILVSGLHNTKGAVDPKLAAASEQKTDAKKTAKEDDAPIDADGKRTTETTLQTEAKDGGAKKDSQPISPLLLGTWGEKRQGKGTVDTPSTNSEQKDINNKDLSNKDYNPKNNKEDNKEEDTEKKWDKDKPKNEDKNKKTTPDNQEEKTNKITMTPEELDSFYEETNDEYNRLMSLEMKYQALHLQKAAAIKSNNDTAPKEIVIDNKSVKRGDFLKLLSVLEKQIDWVTKKISQKMEDISQKWISLSSRFDKFSYNQSQRKVVRSINNYFVQIFGAKNIKGELHQNSTTKSTLKKMIKKVDKLFKNAQKNKVTIEVSWEEAYDNLKSLTVNVPLFYEKNEACKELQEYNDEIKDKLNKDVFARWKNNEMTESDAKKVMKVMKKKLLVKYHPDKFENATPQKKQQAEKTFKKINNHIDNIKKYYKIK